MFIPYLVLTRDDLLNGKTFLSMEESVDRSTPDLKGLVEETSGIAATGGGEDEFESVKGTASTELSSDLFNLITVCRVFWPLLMMLLLLQREIISNLAVIFTVKIPVPK